MHDLVFRIIATISFLSLVLYDFLCICRMLNKKDWVEKIWKQILPNKEYSEVLVFGLIRSLSLSISAITYLFAGKILIMNPIFMLLLSITPILALINLLITIKKG